MSIRHPIRTLSVLVAFSLVGLQPAAAQTTQIRSGAVDVRDLNLNTEAGASAVLRRIRHVADSLCAPAEDEMQTGAAPDFACRSDAVKHAVQALGNPLVTAMLHGGRQAVQAQLAVAQR